MLLRFSAPLAVLLVTAAMGSPLAAAEPTPQQLEFFEKKVRPVLVEYCYKCHSADSKKLKGGLLMDSRAGLLKGGDTGPAYSNDAPEKSLLLKAISYTDVELEMPPKGKLPAQHIDAINQWVKMGAPWPNDGKTTAGPVKTFDLQKRKASHWSWKPLSNPTGPTVKQKAWPRDSIDRFILAKLEERQLTPAVEATRRQWIRRVTNDLIGLPPSVEEVNAFLKDKTANAYETVVDRLLASSHFGERWARHWMDLARYAESYGHEFDYNLPHAHQYRDYLIRAFNNDLPYNRFVMEHIAGDELEPRLHPTEKYNEAIIATGFWWLGEATHAPVDVREDEAGRVDNQIDVFSKSFLGLTVACARCHDHKFDAISTKDYYALAGFLQSSRRDMAYLDPQQKIEQTVAKIKSLRKQGDERLAQRLNQIRPVNARTITMYLMAALEAQRAPRVRQPERKRPAKQGKQVKQPKQGLIISDEVIEQIADDHKLDATTLRNWVDALSDSQINAPSHPAYAWHRLANPTITAAAAFKANREKLAQELGVQTKNAATTDTESPLLADFEGGDADGWMSTGWAFDDAPTHVGQWSGDGSESDQSQMLTPGVIDGRVNGAKLRGTLRSPTFTLDRSRVSVRLKGQGVQARLIIDGYFMEPRNGLLFRGTRIAKVNTKDQFQWITFGGDTQRYRGHTAWIEIVDEGDGYAIVDEARLTDSGTIHHHPSGIAVAIASDPTVRSNQTLANSLAKHATAAIKSWQQNAKQLSPDDAAMANWLMGHNLVSAKVNAGEAAAFDKAATELRNLQNSVMNPMPILAMANGSGENEHVFIRGKHRNLGDEVPRRLLEAIDPEPITPKHASGRLELAKKVVDPANPYVSRVIVNRLWHHLFGRGIVPTVDDFGFLGQRPTHVELLDHLATGFLKDGWSIKKTLRKMVLTATYRMDTKHQSDAMIAKANEVDPANVYLHKARIRRLQAEAVRDGVLAISGRLDRKLYGPSVNVHLTSFMEGRGRPAGGPLDGAGRRSIYIAVRRNFITPMFLAYDFPVPFNAMGRRTVSNVPAQALIMMNDPFIVQQAQQWAKQLIAKESDATKRITLMYEQALARPPRSNEVADALAFLESQAKTHKVASTDPRVWADLCHVMMNVKEFIYLH